MSDITSRKAPETLREEALRWVIRLREADAADWQAFEQWMAHDARAADIYWDMAVADADVEDALARPRPAASVPPPAERASTRKWFVGGALALAASILLILFVPPADSSYPIETLSAEPRRIAMDDGSNILLDGRSKLMLDRKVPRRVRLEEGAARFTVSHDAARPFRVDVGEAELVDLGTVFSVTRQNGMVRVEVAEGAVRYIGGGARRDLNAGDTLRIGADGRLVQGRVDPADVAAWANGRLSYTAVDVSAVAADLSRLTGQDIAVDPAVSKRLFSGGFALGNRDANTLRRAAALMGLTVRATDDGWILEAPASGSK